MAEGRVCGGQQSVVVGCVDRVCSGHCRSPGAGYHFIAKGNQATLQNGTTSRFGFELRYRSALARSHLEDFIQELNHRLASGVAGFAVTLHCCTLIGAKVPVDRLNLVLR